MNAEKVSDDLFAKAENPPWLPEDAKDEALRTGAEKDEGDAEAPNAGAAEPNEV